MRAGIGRHRKPPLGTPNGTTRPVSSRPREPSCEGRIGALAAQQEVSKPNGRSSGPGAANQPPDQATYPKRHNMARLDVLGRHLRESSHPASSSLGRSAGAWWSFGKRTPPRACSSTGRQGGGHRPSSSLTSWMPAEVPAADRHPPSCVESDRLSGRPPVGCPEQGACQRAEVDSHPAWLTADPP